MRQFILNSTMPHLPLTALSVLSCVAAAGLSLDDAETALEHYHDPEGRGAMVKLPWQGGEITVIDDAYNASPVSMRGALKRLGSMSGRRIAVLGEMLELGETTPQLHAEMAPFVKNAVIEQLFLVGNGMQALRDALDSEMTIYWTETESEIRELLQESINPDDVILLKGSHGSGVYRLLDWLKNSNRYYAL